MATDLLAHFTRQLSPENRQWLEDQPADKQQTLAERWRATEQGAAATLLSSVDLLPDLVDEGASANAFLHDIRESENR